MAKGFGRCLAAFLQAPGLPFADVLTERQIDEAFAAEGADFAHNQRDVYTPSMTLWAFLSQMLHSGVLRSCAAAVSRVRVLCAVRGDQVPSPDTGNYCRARAKLPEGVLQRLVYQVAEGLESRVPGDWLWQGRHVKIADGTTLRAPDKQANKDVWPQPRSQKPGVGFPLLRMVVILGLATATVCGIALGPGKGKETGETALLRSLSGSFRKGDIFLGDCYFSSYFVLAMFLNQGVDVVVRQHQRRKTDFHRGQRLGKEDHLVLWQRPSRPKWMDQATYATIPRTLLVRELKVHVSIRGFRTQEVIVATTLTDSERYSKDALADLFRQRWHVELDLRNIKVTLHLDDLRGQSPEMVRREILVSWLAHNLIRQVMAQAALAHATVPRQLSFAGAVDAVVGAWDHATVADEARLRTLAQVQHRFIASFRVGDRPNRIEPRAVKRRPKPHKLLRRPRNEAREELLAKHAT
jgi:putative transposase